MKRLLKLGRSWELFKIMIPQEKNKYIETVISWMESGTSREEAVKRLRDNGVGLLTADTIVSKSYNSVLKAYNNELVGILKKDDTIDIELKIKEIVPVHFTQEVTSIIQKRFVREVRLDVISDMHEKRPIAQILSDYENSFVSRNQIKKWIISFHDNLNERERLVKRAYIRVGMIIACFCFLFFTFITRNYDTDVSFLKVRLVIYPICFGLMGIGIAFYGWFKQVSEYPKI